MKHKLLIGVLALAVLSVLHITTTHALTGDTLDTFKVTATSTITPRNASNTFQVPALKSSNQCLATNASGTFFTTSCGGGASGSSTILTAGGGSTSNVNVTLGTSSPALSIVCNSTTCTWGYSSSTLNLNAFLTSAIQSLQGLSTSSITLTTSTQASTFNITTVNGNQIRLTIPPAGDQYFAPSTTIPTNTNQLTNGAGFITGNQSITLSGDVTGSGATSIATTLDVTKTFAFSALGNTTSTANISAGSMKINGDKVSTSTGANPTQSFDGAVHNGTANTFKRSDAVSAFASTVNGTSSVFNLATTTVTTSLNVNTSTNSDPITLQGNQHIAAGQLYQDFFWNATSTGGTNTINWNNSPTQGLVLGNSTQTIAFSNVKSGGKYTLWLAQDTVGSRTVTWTTTGAGRIQWASSTVPTLTTTTSNMDPISFQCFIPRTTSTLSCYGQNGSGNFTP